MFFLLAKIWVWLFPMFIIGLATGWWIWRYQAMRQLAHMHKTLDAVRHEEAAAQAARAHTEKSLREVDAQSTLLMTAMTEHAQEAERLRQNQTMLSDYTQERQALQGEIEKYRAALEQYQEAERAKAETLPLFLSKPAGVPDNLRLIKGIDPSLHARLSGLGIFHFKQIAQWSPEDLVQLDSKLLDIKKKILQEDWIGQATLLAAGDHLGFEKRYGPLS